MKKGDKKSIELTKEQYLDLAKVVYLGNWMANAQRDGSPENPHIEEYDNISDLIFSFATQFGFEKYTDHEASDGSRYFPSNDFTEDTKVHELHDEYDEENFWDELSERLGGRDFYKKYSERDFNKMTREERFMKMQECETAWEDEFENHGLNRVEILKQAKDFGIQI